MIFPVELGEVVLNAPKKLPFEQLFRAKYRGDE